MSERKSFLIRVDPKLLDSLQRWANDDLRSLNGQIEFLLRDALRRGGRAPRAAEVPADTMRPVGEDPGIPSPPPQETR